MKLSAYYKKLGYQVELKMDYDNLDQYDKVFISKVFMDTEIPFEPNDKTLKKEETIIKFYKDNELLNMNNVSFGGTGFYYDKAPPLPDEIEHIMPDYHLYDDYIRNQIKAGSKEKDFTYFTDWSIGMTGRIVDIDNVAKERELAVKMDKTKYNESFYAYIDMDNVE